MFNADDYRTWAEIDLEAMAHNMRIIRKMTNENAKIMAVIKANAYGHGMLQAYRVLRENGADCFAVATLQEAVELRTGGATEPILILGYVPEDAAETLIKHEIMPTVYNENTAKHLSQAAVRLKKNLRIHIKLDTGMSRLGFAAAEEMAQNTVESIAHISTLENIVIDGIFSHFSCSDTDRDYTKLQYNRFMHICDALRGKGIDVGIRHICNSAGIVLEPDMHLDMVRPGIILYGLHPDETTYGKIDLKPAMTWKARITHIKEIKSGTPVSYGNTYTAPQDMRVGTVCVGYADGYSRTMSGQAEMFVCGQRVKQIGRICMDQCMIDLTNVHTIHVGDEVVLMGEGFSADAMAKLLNTINYEVVCDIGARVPRIYRTAE